MNKIFPNWWQGISIFLTILLLKLSSDLITIYILKKADPYLIIFISYILFLVLFAPMFWIICKKGDLRLRNQFKFPGVVITWCALSIALISPFILRPIAYFHHYFAFITGDPSFTMPPPLFTSTNAFFILDRFVLALIIGPIFEELLFRGILLKQYLKQFSPSVCFIAISLAFSFIHSKEAMAGAFFVSILISYIYFLTHSLLLSIFFHVFFNFTSFCIVPFFAREFGSFFFSLWYLLFILGFGVLIIILLRIIDKKYRVEII